MGIKKSNEQFISEISEIFKDKPYSFEKVVYTGARDYVIATCSIHGDWSVMATNLLGGKGCRGCRTDKTASIRRKDTAYFIKKSKDVHGDRYDYSKSVYVNNTTNVVISCKEHGDFLQQPVAHYSGSGCVRCVIRVVTTLDDFCEYLDEHKVSNWVFEGLSGSSSIKITDKVKITCKQHNSTFNSSFSQLAERKTCCEVTRVISAAESQMTDFSVYVKEMQNVHGGKYEYIDDFGLVSKKTKIGILCKDHGKFYQTISHHLDRKQVCSECAKVLRGERKSKVWKESLPTKLEKL